MSRSVARASAASTSCRTAAESGSKRSPRSTSLPWRSSPRATDPKAAASRTAGRASSWRPRSARTDMASSYQRSALRTGVPSAGLPPRGLHGEPHPGDDEERSDDDPQGQRLAHPEGPHRHGNDGEDVVDQRQRGRRDLREQPEVDAEGDGGAAKGEIEEGEDGGTVEDEGTAALADRRQSAHDDGGDRHRHGGDGEGMDAAAPALDRHLSEGGEERRDQVDGRDLRHPPPAEDGEVLREDDGDAAEAEQDAQRCQRIEPLGGECEVGEEGDPEGEGGEEHRR